MHFHPGSTIIDPASMMGKAKAAEGSGDKILVTREEFLEFSTELQKKFEDITRSQVQMADAQADTNENLNNVQFDTNSRLDKITELLTGVLVNR
jgi:hypothetical protein